MTTVGHYDSVEAAQVTTDDGWLAVTRRGPNAVVMVAGWLMRMLFCRRAHGWVGDEVRDDD
jgi:hypothetical protein